MVHNKMDRFFDSELDSDWDDLGDFLTSDSSDSDDLLELVISPIMTKTFNFIEDAVAKYDDKTFFSHFRISRNIATSIAARYKESSYFKEDGNGKYGKISAMHEVLIFLWFVGNHESSFRSVSNQFNVSTSTMHRIIKKLSLFLSNLTPEIIIWPNEDEKQKSEAFFSKKGFPNIIGVIDGTHIKIDKPDDDPYSYTNKKGYYSMQMQAVCDHNHKIIDIFIGSPGSMQNYQFFRNSPLYQSIEQKCGLYFLIGDSGYPLLKNLLTPYKEKDDQLTPRQINYNKKLRENRQSIEHCFGILMQKFRQLHHVKLKNIEAIFHFIRACCVLHNISLNDVFIVDIKQQMEQSALTADLKDEEAEDDMDARLVRERMVDLLA